MAVGAALPFGPGDDVAEPHAISTATITILARVFITLTTSRATIVYLDKTPRTYETINYGRQLRSARRATGYLPAAAALPTGALKGDVS
jgi:hypothetical protein